jgi:hypothetical protein
VQVHPAEPRDVEGGLRQQRPVGDDRAGIRRELGQPREEGRITGARGRQDFDAVFVGERTDGRPEDPPAAPGLRIGPGDHGNDLVPAGIEQGAQGGNRRVGSAGEDELHRPTPGGSRVSGGWNIEAESRRPLTGGAPVPRCADPRPGTDLSTPRS